MKISQECLRALQTIRDNPGASATSFAKLYWPHLVTGGRMNPRLRAAQYLNWLWKQKLVRRKYAAPILKPGDVKPYAIYYLNELGFEVALENEDRNSRRGHH